MSEPYHLKQPPVDPEHATPEARAVLEWAKGRVPNMYLMMARQPAVLDTDLYGYEPFRKGAGFTPVEQEVVFLTLSVENGCEYCAGAHSFLADHVSNAPGDVTDAIRDGRPIAEPKLEALWAFTRAMHDTRGRPSQADAEAFLNAGYREEHILGIILGLAVKTISNYTSHVSDTPLDVTFQPREWRPASRS
ncbi:carboxymuconolactone decarboxylase family protein (plasmid) [Deinococcus taeanensis]|uniref:carboxymuconolactone decarboxylase family protein n=1 Tax=Deinococcus taeanensis TaxID=2737050 RepID=UPI001CDC2519|nr:carboxymuconolactone decarboxylase family protein [Deinococcus taeanensis]UBV44588.1 carboxymuconolactone decarboxylase family protein [Deinococcus taeanensis]